MKRFIAIPLILLSSIVCFAQSSVKRPDTYNYNRGLEELHNENYDQALSYLNKEVENDPKNGYAYSWVAMIRYTKKEYGKALTAANLALRKLPKKDGEFIAATFNVRAGVYLALEDTLKAMSDFASAIKACPTDDDAYGKRAQIYYEQEKYDLSDADYKELLKLDQGNLNGYMGIGRNKNAQKRWDEAIEQFNHVVNMYSDYSSAYSFRAEAYIGKEKWAEATDDIIKALSLSADDKAFSLMQDLKDSAFEMLVTKLKIQSKKNPNSPYWPYCLGAIYENNEQYEVALPFYEDAQRKDADDMTLRRIAQCHYEMGDYDAALRIINQAIELDSTQHQYLPFKADVLHETGNTKGAIAEWDKHQELYPDYGLGYHYRGWFKSLASDYKGAIDDYTMSITLEPGFAYTYLCRGDAYRAQGKTQLAKADYQKVIELENTPDKYDCLHYAYLGLGENDKAIAVIDTIIARSENKKRYYYDAACLYSRMGNKEKSLEYMTKCFEMGYYRFAHIRADNDLDFIRKTPEFKTIIEKYENAVRERFSKSSNNEPIVEEVTTEVPFTKENGICKVKCKVNDLPLYFVFDTGASSVSLSMVEANFMMKNGYLDKKDVIGSQYFLDANGNIGEGTIINIRQVDFGGLRLENVRASVVRNQKAPLLLGQTVLNRLGRIEIDNTNHNLRITQCTR